MSYAELPITSLGHHIGSGGRYLRQPRNAAPCCSVCGARYSARHSRQSITYYYPQCLCAPRGSIRRTRPVKQPLPIVARDDATR
jgi:hypothetical protein